MRLLDGIKSFLRKFKALVGSKPESAEVHAEPDSQLEQPEFGKVYEGKVVKILEQGDGAIVNLLPGIDGLLHISEISHRYVANANDHLQVGQLIKVKVIGFNEHGSLLSIKALDSSERELPELGKVYEGKVVKFLEHGDGALVRLLPGIVSLLHKSEISHRFVENADDHLQVGQLIKVKVIGFNEHGSLLSIKALDSSERELPEIGKVYEGKVIKFLEHGDGALVRLLPGIVGLLHKSEISHRFVENADDHLQIGQMVNVKVIKTDDSGNVGLSKKALDSSEREQPELGKVYEGKVVKFLEQGDGAIVRFLPDIDGLLHLSEISPRFVENINDHLQIGQQIKVKVIGFNEHWSLLSIKALDSSERELPEIGKVYEGKVIKFLEHGDGALVRLLPGIVGLLHKSEISHRFVENADDHLQIGQMVNVKVIKADDSGNVGLSKKALDSSEREQPELGKVYEGKVIKFLEQGDGAIVRLLPDIDGLLHLSEISHRFVENINDHLQIGQQIKVKVIGFNEHWSLLSIKALDSSERELPELGKVYEGKVVKFLEHGDGALVRLLPGINGLLHKSEISHKFVANANDHLQVGQLIKVKVIRINERGGILSMKALDSSKHEAAEV